jgi:hypothetical protein
MPHMLQWEYYRLCPRCGRPYGRGKNGRLAKHGCIGEQAFFKDLPKIDKDRRHRFINGSVYADKDQSGKEAKRASDK